jgi:hypothetical protein
LVQRNGVPALKKGNVPSLLLSAGSQLG